jgi:hypothetical protein
MEIKDYVKNEFDSLKRTSTRVLDTVTQQELMWRPANGCNYMGLILFHVVRSEDSFAQTRLQGKPQIWESEKWYSKLDMGEAETGSHYTVDQVNAFRVPIMKELLDYYDAVHVSTLDYLSSLTSDAFDKVVKFAIWRIHRGRGSCPCHKSYVPASR